MSLKLLEQMAAFLNHGITPVVPCEGSVGASGDLTPMSYVAAGTDGDERGVLPGRAHACRRGPEVIGACPVCFCPERGYFHAERQPSIMTGIAILAVEESHPHPQCPPSAPRPLPFTP